MTARPSATLPALTLLAVLIAAACSDGESDLPLHPQIVPHINPVNLCKVEFPPPGVVCSTVEEDDLPCAVGECSCATDPCTCIARQVTVDVMLFNQGQERLEISELDVSSDRRCAFTDTETSHRGDVSLFDDEPADDFLATAKSRAAAFLRIRYSPPQTEPAEDEITVRVHSNAENFPEPEGAPIYVCAAGTTETTLDCRIRVDPECSDDEARAYACDPGPDAEVPNPCPSFCYQSGAECRLPTADDPGVPCPEGDACQSPWYCVPSPGDPTEGTCLCRPCAVPPDEGWDDCAAGG